MINNRPVHRRGRLQPIWYDTVYSCGIWYIDIRLGLAACSPQESVKNCYECCLWSVHDPCDTNNQHSTVVSGCDMLCHALCFFSFFFGTNFFSRFSSTIELFINSKCGILLRYTVCLRKLTAFYAPWLAIFCQIFKPINEQQQKINMVIFFTGYFVLNVKNNYLCTSPYTQREEDGGFISRSTDLDLDLDLAHLQPEASETSSWSFTHTVRVCRLYNVRVQCFVAPEGAVL